MATNSRVFNLTINGVQTAITNIGQLESTVQTLEQQLNTAQFGTQQFDDLQKELLKARQALAQVQNATNNAANGANQAGQNAKQMGGQFQDAFNLASLAAGDTGNALNALQGGFNSVQGGLSTVVKGFGTLKGAIASTGIGILLLAFGALVTYFTRSQEGMDFLDRKTKALQAVFQLLSDKVVAVGKFLFDAFSHPKQSLNDLVDLIQNNLKKRLESFAVVLDGIRNADFEKVTNGIIQFGTGIEDATGKARTLAANMKQFAKEASDAADKAEKIAASNQQIAREERNLNVERAESRARIEALKKASDDVTKSNAFRTEAAKQAAAIEQDLINKQLSLQDRKIANLRAEQALKKNITGEDKDALAELRKQRAEVAQESLTVQTELQNKVNGLNAEAKAKAEADTAAKKAADEKAAAEKKALLDKEIADEQAATAIKFSNQKAAIERELAQAQQGSNEQLALLKRQKELETEIALAAITDKYEKAGTKEKAALAEQVVEVTKAGEAAQKKVEDDFAKARVAKAAQDEADRAAAKLVGLKDGTAAYYAALLEQVNAEERLALSQLDSTKDNEAQKTKIIADAAAKRKAIQESAVVRPDLTTSILKNIFGVADKDVQDVKNALDSAAQYATQVTLQLLDNMTQARLKAIEAQITEADQIIQGAKDAADALTAQMDESQSRIDELENRLVNTKGAERARVIAQLEAERQREAALAAQKKAEDDRAKKAEQDKLALEKQRSQEQEKQTKIQQTMNALQAIGAAIGATEAAVTSVKAIASAGANGKFGFDNVAYILAATAAIAGAVVAVKSALKGFDKGGFTGSGFGTPDSSGYRVAGVVHENEYVVPAWMVTSPQFSSTIAQLESARVNGGRGYANGGYAQVSVPAPQKGIDLSILVDMQQNIMLLQAQTNEALAKPIYTRPTDIREYETQKSQITDYFLN